MDEIEELEEAEELPFDEVQCPACASEQAVYLGQLGRRHQLRCRSCGVDFSREAEPVG